MTLRGRARPRVLAAFSETKMILAINFDGRTTRLEAVHRKVRDCFAFGRNTTYASRANVCNLSFFPFFACGTCSVNRTYRRGQCTCVTRSIDVFPRARTTFNPVAVRRTDNANFRVQVRTIRSFYVTRCLHCSSARGLPWFV